MAFKSFSTLAFQETFPKQFFFFYVANDGVFSVQKSIVCHWQVVGFAVFFALVLKKVDEEEDDLLDGELGLPGWSSGLPIQHYIKQIPSFLKFFFLKTTPAKMFE